MNFVSNEEYRVMPNTITTLISSNVTIFRIITCRMDTPSCAKNGKSKTASVIASSLVGRKHSGGAWTNDRRMRHLGITVIKIK